MYKVLVKNAAFTPSNLAKSGLVDMDFNNCNFDIYTSVYNEAYGHSYALHISVCTSTHYNMAIQMDHFFTAREARANNLPISR